MSADELERAVRAFARRRPFQPYLLEMVSGDRLLVTHPEAVRRQGTLFVHYAPDRHPRIFSGESVCQLLDPPTEPATR
jgi:hypothetical protein